MMLTAGVSGLGAGIMRAFKLFGLLPCRCKRGRCPICFPTILHLEQSGKVASAEQQMQVQRKIWDMEFWCETCNQFGRRAPILKDKLDLPDGQRAGGWRQSAHPQERA